MFETARYRAARNLLLENMSIHSDTSVFCAVTVFRLLRMSVILLPTVKSRLHELAAVDFQSPVW